MHEQLSIKVRIYLKDIDASFYIKLHQGTTFRNILEIIHDSQFYENFNKSEYCALFYGNQYIQDREAQIIVNFQLKYNEEKSSILTQNLDIETLEFIRNKEFTERKQTSEEANNTQDQFYQYKQSQIRKNQGNKNDNQVKIKQEQQDQGHAEEDIKQQNALFLQDKGQDLTNIWKIENENQPQPQYGLSQIQIPNNSQSQSQLFKTQQELNINMQQNQNYGEQDIHQVQLIQSNLYINESQNNQLRLIRFVSLNSLRVDLDDFESIRTIHLIGYENYNINQIKDFVLRAQNLQGKSIFIKFNENEEIDQSTILRINKNYLRLYVHDKQIKKYQVQYNFNLNNDYYQMIFNEILPEGLENEHIKKQYNLQNYQVRIIKDKIYFGAEQNQKLVKQHAFIFQFQSLTIFKYELKYFSKSDLDPQQLFEEFFKCKFNYRMDKNNYVIDI